MRPCTAKPCCEIQRSENRMQIFLGRLWLKKSCFANDDDNEDDDDDRVFIYLTVLF
jgi:hypothetical protein